jgi:hypothetical protein
VRHAAVGADRNHLQLPGVARQVKAVVADRDAAAVERALLGALALRVQTDGGDRADLARGDLRARAAGVGAPEEG